MSWKKIQPKKIDHEHNHQSAGVDWAKLNTYRFRELVLLYAVPNAGKRSVRMGAYYKAEGLKPGQPDLTLPVARRGFHSLYIETKVPNTPVSKKTYPSKLQKAVMWDLAHEGNLVVVCWGSIAIQEVLEHYLKVPVVVETDRLLRQITIKYLNTLKNVEVINRAV